MPCVNIGKQTANVIVELRHIVREFKGAISIHLYLCMNICYKYVYIHETMNIQVKYLKH